MTCPICGSSDTVVRWNAQLPESLTASEFSYVGNKRHHGRILECRACTHMFVNPIPANLHAMYGDVEDPFYASTEPERRKTFDEFLDVKESVCEARGTLLDVGCYTGVLLSAARDRGYRVSGLELSRWAAGIARTKGHDVISRPIEQISESDAYDNVTAFDVVEHLPDPVAAISTIRRMLRPGGCFSATVPDMGAWHARLLGRRHWLVVVMHLQYFNRRSFGQLLERAGFSSVTITAAPPYRLKLVDAARYSEATAALRYPMELLARVPYARRIELRLRASLFCVARK
jgi:SAM-dependent methyltransferase